MRRQLETGRKRTDPHRVTAKIRQADLFENLTSRRIEFVELNTDKRSMRTIGLGKKFLAMLLIIAQLVHAGLVFGAEHEACVLKAIQTIGFDLEPIGIEQEVLRVAQTRRRMAEVLASHLDEIVRSLPQPLRTQIESILSHRIRILADDIYHKQYGGDSIGQWDVTKQEIVLSDRYRGIFLSLAVLAHEFDHGLYYYRGRTGRNPVIAFIFRYLTPHTLTTERGAFGAEYELWQRMLNARISRRDVGEVLCDELAIDHDLREHIINMFSHIQVDRNGQVSYPNLPEKTGVLLANPESRTRLENVFRRVQRRDYLPPENQSRSEFVEHSVSSDDYQNQNIEDYLRIIQNVGRFSGNVLKQAFVVIAIAAMVALVSRSLKDRCIGQDRSHCQTR